MLSLDASGWVVGVCAIPSPNCDRRPEEMAVDLLVLHSISLPEGEYGGPEIAALFTNTLDCAAHPSFAALAELRVSCHFLVRRDGQLMQFVPCEARAWHAGVSSFEGRPACNDFSIGIELEGTDRDVFTAAQYAALQPLMAALTQRYPLIAVAAHSEIAPGRKTDPGPGLDWSRVHSFAPHLRRLRATPAA